MGTRIFYTSKADDCVTIAARIADPAERLALLKIAGCFMLLARNAAEKEGALAYPVFTHTPKM